jgi:hypothetical protein
MPRAFALVHRDNVDPCEHELFELQWQRDIVDESAQQVEAKCALGAAPACLNAWNNLQAAKDAEGRLTTAAAGCGIPNRKKPWPVLVPPAIRSGKPPIVI